MSEIKVSQRVSIRPYISGLPNAGLEKYDLVIAEAAQHKELLGLVERNGIKCYQTGLNEMAPEVQGIRDQEKKDAVIRDIRKTIVFLENTLAGNNAISEKDIDEYDKDGKATGKFSDQFWAKVTMFISQGPDVMQPDGKGTSRKPTFWDSVEVKCGNQPIFLDPKNPHDLVLIYAIKAGGFTIVAPSLDAARNAVEVPKWYLDREEETAGIKTEVKKLRNKAGSELQKLFDKDTTKLFYITKLCAINSLSYRKTTSNDILYNDCDMYINGETVDKNKKATAEKFLEYCKADMKDLRVQAIVRDATEMHLLTFKQDGQLYYNRTNSPMGKGVPDVVAYLQNPLNTDVLDTISKEVEEEWKK
jgi:hypothetical protein